jgi:hypothetical protein
MYAHVNKLKKKEVLCSKIIIFKVKLRLRDYGLWTLLPHCNYTLPWA